MSKRLAGWIAGAGLAIIIILGFILAILATMGRFA